MKKIQIPKERWKKILQWKEKLTREQIKAYWRERKEKRQRRLEKRRNSVFARKVKLFCLWLNRFSLIGHGLLACFLNFLIEAISRHSVLEAGAYMTGTPWVFLYNSFLIFVTFSLVYLVRKRIFLRLVISLIWLTLGVCNGYLLLKRVTPFNAQDLRVLEDAVSLLHSYLSDAEIIGIVITLILLFLGLLLLWFRGGRYEGKIHRLAALVFCGAWFILLQFVTEQAINQRVLSSYFANIAFAYEDYGCPYCFVTSVFDTGGSKPDSYEKETIDEITDNGSLTSTVSAGEEEALPNVIFIQWESFFDVGEVSWLQTSQDPTPNFNALRQSYSTGYFKVPSIGAGTSNTEFEVLTGFSMRYFGAGEYPYKTILKYEACESAATALKNLGYSTCALHNNGGNFYSRADVFDNMGFDSFVSKEFMNILQYTENGWAKDDVLNKYILEAMDSTEGSDFVFAVNVQCHGSYPTEQVLEDPVIQVTGTANESENNAWTYYVNQLYETDRAIGELLQELEERGEPAVVVIYGDHLPTMNLEEEDLNSRYLYNTNYVIWDNIGLEKQDYNVSAYQIMADVMERLNLQSGTVFRYHQLRRKTKNYLADLELLQYDILYGEQYAYDEVASPAIEGQMEMGLRDTTITGFAVQANGNYSIYGTDFTKSSKVYINGKQQTTSFLNNTRINLNNCILQEGDRLVINQVGSKSRIFRSSAEYVYHEGELVTVEEYEKILLEQQQTESDSQEETS